MAIAKRFPDFPPYRGAYTNIVPHLTVAHGNHEQLNAIAPQLHDSLQLTNGLRARCDELLLIENLSGRWQPLRAFKLRTPIS